MPRFSSSVSSPIDALALLDFWFDSLLPMADTIRNSAGPVRVGDLWPGISAGGSTAGLDLIGSGNCFGFVCIFKGLLEDIPTKPDFVLVGSPPIERGTLPDGKVIAITPEPLNSFFHGRIPTENPISGHIAFIGSNRGLNWYS